MFRFLGILVGAGLVAGVFLLWVDELGETTQPAVVEVPPASLEAEVLVEGDELPEPTAGQSDDTAIGSSVNGGGAQEESSTGSEELGLHEEHAVSQAIEAVSAAAFEPGAEPIQLPVAGEGESSRPLSDETPDATTIAQQDQGEPEYLEDYRWEPIWGPFRIRRSADGFAARLATQTGLTFRVQDGGKGAFYVAMAYRDEEERRNHLHRIERVTGLHLEVNRDE